MKTMLCLLALALLQGSALFAQNIVGAWQGALELPQNGKQLRIVIKISTTDNDKLKAVMYSIDQGGQGIAVTQFTRQGPDVKLVVGGIGGTYDGKLNADGNTITGTWTQGPKPMPLNLARANAETAWTIPEPPKRMAADANPSFEVATIKPSKPGTIGKGFRVNGRRFTTINTSVTDLMTFAYGLQEKQIIGGPEWMATQKYDLEGEPDAEGTPNDKQLKGMLQKLLADRFKLAFHHDKKELSAYTIVVAKNGPKLTKSASDPNSLPGLGFRGLGAFVAHNATLTDFANVMETVALDRPVVDQTGLQGRFDFTLNWTPDETQFAGLGVRPPAPPENATEPDLFTAIQQQLGLKLESTKAPVDVLVIDHVEMPSAN
ncbi:MAG TPA: TIGR03435 family protein [Bryobacteraceae bacterium]|nr:TIGR03435 family protein [Bryobacteraceae bacterium]